MLPNMEITKYRRLHKGQKRKLLNMEGYTKPKKGKCEIFITLKLMHNFLKQCQAAVREGKVDGNSGIAVNQVLRRIA